MGNIFKKFLPAIAGAVTGGVMSNMGNAANYSALGSTAAGALAAGATKQNIGGGALQGFAGGGVGAGIAGGIKSNTGFGGGFMNGLKSFGNSIPGFGGVGTANPTGAMAKFFTPQSIQSGNAKNGMTAIGQMSPTGNRASFAPSPLKPSIQTPKFTAPSASGTPAGSISGSIGDRFKSIGGGNGGMNIGQFGAGMAMPMIASALTPDVNATDFSSVTGPLREQIAASKDPQVEAFYRQQMAANPVDSTPGLAVDKLAHDKQVADNLRTFDQQWTNAMAGQDPTNNSEYQVQRQKILSDAEANWTANQSQFQFQYDQMQQQQRYAAAAALQGLSDSQLNAYASLAQYDAYTLSEQTGMELAKAENLIKIGQTAGEMLMQKSLGMYDSQTRMA
jgi:hypothetical protein